MKTFIAIAFCLVSGAPVPELGASNLVPPPMPRAQAEIYARVTSRVLAPCCWSQPVQTHQSEAAEKVRAEVFAYIRQGQGEQEIFERLAAEYGERILGEPRGIRGTIAIVTPFAILSIGLLAVIFVLLRVVRPRHQRLSYPVPLPDLPEFEA